MPRLLPIVVAELLEKARASALLAVETFNRPSAEFRVQAFIVLMHTAWTSLLLAKLIRDDQRPYYRQKDGRRYVRIDGEKKAWGLGDCIQHVWLSDDDPVRQNLRFFIQLRNKIEHYRDQALLSTLTFGECQSLIVNFEDFLADSFGDRYSIADRLALSLQLSRLRDRAREGSFLAATDRATRDVRDFITQFRSSLSDDVFADMRYSHKLFLLPKTANHLSRDAIAIEWLDMDALTPEERERVDKAVAMIKRQQVPVQNLGKLKPGDVCRRVKQELNLPAFDPSYQHVKCWRYFNVRPPSDSPTPDATDRRYCLWDAVHKDYVYTEVWVEFLLRELQDAERRAEIYQAS